MLFTCLPCEPLVAHGCFGASAVVAFSAGVVQSRASGSLREYARVLPSWLLTVRLRLSSTIEFPCDVMSCAAMSGRIRFVSLYTFALIVIDPEFTRAAADEMVVLPFGYIATVGTCLICRAFAGTEFSGIEVSSAPQSSIGGSEFLFVLVM